MPLLLAILGLDVRALPGLGAVESDLNVRGLAEPEETLQRTNSRQIRPLGPSPNPLSRTCTHHNNVLSKSPVFQVRL